MIRRPPRSTQSRSSAASDVYKRQLETSLDLRHRMMERRAAVVIERAALPRRPARVSQQMRANDLPIAKVVRLLRQVEGHQVEDQFEPRPVPEHEAPITEPSDDLLEHCLLYTS